MTGDQDLTSEQFDAEYAAGVPVELEGSPRLHLLAEVVVPGGHLMQPANYSFSGAHKVPARLAGSFESRESDTRSTAPASVPA
jgi:hypothetical protein